VSKTSPLPSGDRLARWLPWVTGALLAAPVLIARYPPMTDLPLYEGALSLLRHWGDPAFVPPDLYELNLGRTTQLTFALGLPLSYLMSTAATCKLLVSAAIASLIVGSARLARHVGVTPWVALLAAPVALGWIVFIGFLSYLVGTALWLLSLPLFDRWVDAPTPRRAAAPIAATVLLHFAHLASSACAVIALFVLTLARGVDRRTPLRLLPAALAVALAAVDMNADRSHASASAASWAERGMVWPPLRVKFTMLADYLFGAVGALPQLLIFLLVVATLLAAAVAHRPVRATPADGQVVADDRSAARRRFRWLAVMLLVAYLVSPWAVSAGAYFDGRFLPAAWLVGVAAFPRLPANNVPLIPRLGAVCVALASLAVAWPAFADSDREQRALIQLYPYVRKGSAFAVMPFGQQDQQPYLPVSAGNRMLAERGGRALHSLVEAPRAPLLIARRSRWDEAVARLYANGPQALCPSFDATRFRYLLLRIPALDLTRITILGLQPDYRLQASSGAWLLFESTHPVVPLDSPDEAPAPGEQCLAGRLAALTRAAPPSPSSSSIEMPARPDRPTRVRRDSVRVPLSTGNPREDFWQMHESAPLIEPDEQPRPVTILFHGKCADSSWTCDWLQYFDMAPQWQLCPRAPNKCVSEEGYSWTSGAETRRLVELAVATAKQRHNARVRDDGVVLAGFSLGAYAVASLVHELALRPSPSLPVRGIVAQGAHVQFSATDLRTLGARVVLAAGDLDGAAPAMRAEVERLLREGVDVRYVSLGEDESHFTSVSTGKTIAQLIDWCRDH
jgi:hypothetical protein